MDFESHEVSRLLSVAHLFPRSQSRCGVYILHFANGDRYVGLTRNVVGRFGAHRKRWGDISTLQFARQPAARLDSVEQELIHSEQKKAKIRNVTHALASGLVESAQDVDLVITPDERHAWLNHDVQVSDTDERVDNHGTQPRTREVRAAGGARAR
jgi:predicted GIY-YIG superfamily endonuclease